MLKILDHPSPAAEKALGRIAGRGLAYSRTEYAALGRGPRSPTMSSASPM